MKVTMIGSLDAPTEINLTFSEDIESYFFMNLIQNGMVEFESHKNSSSAFSETFELAKEWQEHGVSRPLEDFPEEMREQFDLSCKCDALTFFPLAAFHLNHMHLLQGD